MHWTWQLNIVSQSARNYCIIHFLEPLDIIKLYKLHSWLRVSYTNNVITHTLFLIFNTIDSFHVGVLNITIYLIIWIAQTKWICERAKSLRQWLCNCQFCNWSNFPSAFCIVFRIVIVVSFCIVILIVIVVSPNFWWWFLCFRSLPWWWSVEGWGFEMLAGGTSHWSHTDDAANSKAANSPIKSIGRL